MGKLLLTSSQVSVLASGVIILFCTLALFLSGYVIQQRTVANLREAIRPRAPRVEAKTHLPDRFKARITELEDGSIVFLESEAEEEARKLKQMNLQVKPSTKETVAQDQAKANAKVQAHAKEQAQTKTSNAEHPDLVQASKKQLELLEQIRHSVAEQSWAVENPDPEAKNRVPITAVERRQLIKEELQRIAGTNELVYWQRRLW